jgi:tetratricopeptide (TPR) repeat protein
MIQQVQKPEEVQAVLAMWLMLGERFLRQEEIQQDDLKQFIADFEAITLPKAEESGEAQLVDGCKHLLGWAYNSLNAQYDNQKDYSQAIAAVSKAIEYQPEMAMYYRNRAGTYMDMKDYASALPDLEKAQELDKDNNRLARLWHDCLVGIGKPEQLLGKIASLAEKHPDQANIHYYTALAYAYVGDDTASIAAMQESSRLASDNQRQSGISTLDELQATLPDFAPIIVKLIDILKEKSSD